MSNLKAWHGREPDCAECVEAAKLGPKSPLPIYLLFAFMGGITLSCVMGCTLELYSARTAGVHSAMLMACFIAAFTVPVFQEQIQGDDVIAYRNEDGVFHVHTQLPRSEEASQWNYFEKPYIYLRLGWGFCVDKSVFVNLDHDWAFSKQSNVQFVLQDALGINVPGLSLRSILSIASASKDWHEIIEHGLRYEELVQRHKDVERRCTQFELARQQENDLGERLAIEATAIILLMEGSRDTLGRSKHAQMVRERLMVVLDEGTLFSQREKWRRLARHKLADEQGVNGQDQAGEAAR